MQTCPILAIAFQMLDVMVSNLAANLVFKILCVVWRAFVFIMLVGHCERSSEYIQNNNTLLAYFLFLGVYCGTKLSNLYNVYTL